MNKFRKLWRNHEFVRLVDNFLSLSAIQLLGYILPFITLPYVLRCIGTEQYGRIVFALSLINYFTAFTDYSFRITGTRAIAHSKHSIRQQSHIFSEVIAVRLLLCIISSLIISSIVITIPSFRKDWLLYTLTVPTLLGYVLFPEWFFQGIERMRTITYLNLGIRIFFTTMIFVFIKQKSDFWIYPLLQTSGHIGAGIVGQYIIIRKYKLKIHWIGWSRIRKILQRNFPIFINQFLPTLYNNTTTFLLGIIADKSIVGIFDALKKVIDALYNLVKVFGRVFFPFLVRKKEAFKYYAKYMLFTGAALSLSPIIFYKLIIVFLGIKYNNSFFVISILSIGIFFAVLYDIFGLNYFIARGKDRIVMNNTMIASIVGISIGIPLIHYYSIEGAAINITIARGITGAGMALLFIKQKRKL